MLDSALVTNQLANLSGKLTEGLPFDIEQYSLYPTSERLQGIMAKLQSIQDKLEILNRNLTQDDLRNDLQLVRNMHQSFDENFKSLQDSLRTKKAFSEV